MAAFTETERKVTIGWPNYGAEATFSGGSYESEFPLELAKETPLTDVARTTDDTNASTQFAMTFSRRRTVGAIAVGNHNLSVEGRVRYRVYNDESPRVLQHDSDWVDAWPAVFSSDELEWEDPNFWFGTPTAEDRARYTPTLIYLLPTPVIFGYQVTVEFDDGTNEDGYVQFGFAFVSNWWQPEQNVEDGFEFEVDDSASSTTQARDGSEYHDKQKRFRRVSMDFTRLQEQEAFNQLYLNMTDLGTTGPLLFVYHQEASVYSIQRQFLARMSRTSVLNARNKNEFQGRGVTFKEIL